MQVKKILQKLKRLDISKLEKDIIYDSVDLNTINNTETGSFNIYCQNKPFEGSGGTIETIKMSEKYAVQKAINLSNGDNYQRNKVSGHWQPWIKKESWISDTNSYILTRNDPTLTIPYSFDQIDEFCFRILGTDSAAFGFLTIPKDLWHNSGAYALSLKAFSCNGNTVVGWANLVCQNKQASSFQIHLQSQSCNAVVVSFKLK